MDRQPEGLKSYTVAKNEMKQKRRYLNHQLIQAIEIIRPNQPPEGECIYGIIGWEGSLMIDDYYSIFFESSEEEPQELEEKLEEKPCYVFCYDGKKLSIIL